MDVDAEASAVDETPGKYSARKKAETKTTVVLPSERVQPATFFFQLAKSVHGFIMMSHCVLRCLNFFTSLPREVAS